MKKTILEIAVLLMISACGNNETQNLSKKQVNADSINTNSLKQTSLTSTVLEQDSMSLPEYLYPFVLPNYEVLKFKKGNLNKDNLEDFVLILAVKNENEKGDALRPLLLLTQNEDKTYILTARNDSIVNCRDCGGKLDPLADISIKNGFFTIEHEGGRRERWTKNITFSFNQELNSWFLHRIDETEIDTSNEKDKGISKTRTEKDFGKILFKEYSFEKMDNK